MDLDALLSALQTTQQKQSSVRLSERNVVELVMKLKQLGLFGEELLHTINGKEYITTDRLKTDIQAALRQEGGRLELTELPALVGVDLVHCEKQVCGGAKPAGPGSSGSITSADTRSTAACSSSGRQHLQPTRAVRRRPSALFTTQQLASSRCRCRCAGTPAGGADCGRVWWLCG